MKCINSNKYFDDIIKSGKNIIFYGAGSKAIQILEICQEMELVPKCFCDANYQQYDQKGIMGIPVMSYEQMKMQYDNYILMLTVTINNAVQIRKQLISKGEKNPIYNLCAPFKVSNELLGYEEFLNNKEKYNAIYNRLEDEKSKELCILNMNYKMTGNAFELFDQTEGEGFFCEELIPIHTNHTYVDIGAYTGDTICSFFAFSRGKYKNIVGIEADEGNFKALKKFVRYSRINNVNLFNKLLWSSKEEKKWYTLTDNSEVNYDSPNIYRSVKDTVDRNNKLIIQQKNIDVCEKKVESDTIDCLLNDYRPTIIKINAMGADLPILLGGAELVRRYKPILITEYGVKKENLVEMIDTIISIRDDYKIYLRQRDIFGDSKTILYAI